MSTTNGKTPPNLFFLDEASDEAQGLPSGTMAELMKIGRPTIRYIRPSDFNFFFDDNGFPRITKRQRFPADDECDKRHYYIRYPCVVRTPPWRQARTHRRSIPNK